MTCLSTDNMKANSVTFYYATETRRKKAVSALNYTTANEFMSNNFFKA